MRTFILLICFLAHLPHLSAQTSAIDSVLHKTDAEPDVNKRIHLLYEYFGSISESEPLTTLKHSQALLIHSQEKEDRVGEILALSMIGYIYRGLGNTVQSLAYNLQSVTMAQEIDNERLLA